MFLKQHIYRIMLLLGGCMKNLGNEQTDGAVRRDRRWLKTKKAVKTALVELMSEKDISQITVKELAQKADINRKTFYTHYTSIYDISDEIENEMIQNLKRLIQESSFASQGFATYSLFKALNDLIYEDFDFYQNLLGHANAHGSLISKIKNALQEEFLRNAKDKNKTLPEQFSYIMEFVSSGIISMYVLWFDSDQKIPLEELAKTAGILVSSGIDTLVKKQAKTNKED